MKRRRKMWVDEDFAKEVNHIKSDLHVSGPRVTKEIAHMIKENKRKGRKLRGWRFEI